MVSPVIPHMGFFETAVGTLCTRRVGILYLKSNENDIPGTRCFSFYRPKDGMEDLGPHAYTIRNSYQV